MENELTAECDQNDAIRPDHRAAILAVRPDLADAPVRLHVDGWDCLAVEVGDAIFKFPLHAAAEERLRREPRALALIAPRVRLAVPRMRLHTVPLLMSEHTMIAGDQVDPARYRALGEAARARLAHDVAGFYADIHTIAPAEVAAADCDALRPFAAPAPLLAPLAGRVEADLGAIAAAVAEAYAAYGPDARVFGHFDTHGWNMAYDVAADRLVGLFDFAGCGVGDLHRDLSYPMFVSADLTRRVVADYRALTGRVVDLERVFAAHGYLRVIELSDAVASGGDAAPLAEALRAFAASAAAGHTGAA